MPSVTDGVQVKNLLPVESVVEKGKDVKPVRERENSKRVVIFVMDKVGINLRKRRIIFTVDGERDRLTQK